MGIKQRNLDRRERNQIRRYKKSILSICGVVLLLIVVLGLSSVSLQMKNTDYKMRESQLESELAKEKERKEYIGEIEKYVGTDEYIEDVAKEKLRLINPNEILFQAEE